MASAGPAAATAPPAFAATQGMTALAFDDEFSTEATIDRSASGRGGYNWYPQNWFATSVTSPSGYSVANGVLTIGDGRSAGGAALVSAIASNTASHYVGSGFGGGFYIEARIAYDPAAPVSANMWPAFWSMAVEHVYDIKNGYADVQWQGQAPGYVNFAELDFFEGYYPKSGASSYLTTIHEWSNVYSPSKGWTGHVQNGNNSFETGAPIGTGFHTYGALWVPATDSSPGYVQWYFDGRAGPIAHYTQTPTQPSQIASGVYTPDQAGEANPTFAVLDDQRLALSLQTSNSSPLQVDYVRVWQRPAEVAGMPDGQIHGTSGADGLRGTDGPDTIHGHVGDDQVRGLGGDDFVYGGQGADTLYGNDGADFLSGDRGADLLFGGRGRDSFAFGVGHGTDWIADFDFAEGDRVVLATGTSYSVTTHAGQVLITLADGDNLGFVGLSPSAFSSDWIIFA
jgi:Ca2+-binding RTX toxin-like protein